MAASSARVTIRRKSSGDRPNSTGRKRPPPPLQRSKKPGDLFSALPDDLIRRIFSYLPLKDVVKTSVLSKHWQSIWTTTTHLVLDGEMLRSTLGFPSLVDSVLSQCTSPVVKRFHITYLDYDKADGPNLDSWLSFAAKRSVEELRLSLFTEPFFYKLPPFLFCSNRLVSLEVSSCRFSLDRTISWPRLKVLSVENAELSDDFLEGIFRGSSLLESLELCGCTGLKNIIIHATSVKKLALVGVLLNVGKICAPHLLSLRVSGEWWPRFKFRLDDVSSLVEAQLDFVIRTEDMRIHRDFVKELFEKLRGVRTITINDWCLQVLSILEMEGVPFPFLKCQNLILHAAVGQWDLPEIAYMLRSSQYLEKLDIHLIGNHFLKLQLDEESREHFNFDEKDFLCSRKGHFQCLAKHLKRVEIAASEAHSLGSTHLDALIKFILGNTLVLEKMIVKVDQGTRRRQEILKPMFFCK